MLLIHSGNCEPIVGKSIFIAGWSAPDFTWKPTAVSWFRHLGFVGTLCVSDDEPSGWDFEYQTKCDYIMFWMPTSITNGTNPLGNWNDFDYWISKEPTKVWYGRMLDWNGKIVGAEKCNLLDELYEKHKGIAPINSLPTTIESVLKQYNT